MSPTLPEQPIVPSPETRVREAAYRDQLSRVLEDARVKNAELLESQRQASDGNAQVLRPIDRRLSSCNHLGGSSPYKIDRKAAVIKNNLLGSPYNNPFNTRYNYSPATSYLSIHLISLLPTLLLDVPSPRPPNTSNQRTLSTHPLNTTYQHPLQTHPENCVINPGPALAQSSGSHRHHARTNHHEATNRSVRITIYPSHIYPTPFYFISDAKALVAVDC